MNKLDLLKSLLLKEEDTVKMEKTPKKFEDDPMNYILTKYQNLDDILKDLMSDNFKDLITGIYIVAYKPTTFKIVLHNGQYMFFTFMGKAYQATIVGKNYFLYTIAEKQKAMLAIARLLRMGAPLKIKGAEGAEQSTDETSSEAPPAETSEPAAGEEETLEESKILSELLSESTEDDIMSILKKNKNITSLGIQKIEKTGKNTYKVYFSSINTRDKKARLDAMKQLISTKGVNAKLAKGLSSIGNIKLQTKSGEANVLFKGSSETATSTNVKEGLVILFFYSKVLKPVTKTSFDSVISSLNKVVVKCPGISEGTRSELSAFLSSANNTPEFINNLNQPLSQALTIKEKYSRFDLTRTGIFDEIRSVAHQKLSIPADKWCPGDVYVVINKDKAQSIIKKAQTQDSAQAAGILSNAFVSKWGLVNAPLVAVSLKFEKAQGGKAKAYFEKFKKAKTEYNLTDDEQNYSEIKYREGIQRLRKSILSFIGKNPNIKYELADSDVKKIKKDQLRGKYAALKSLNFFFSQIASDEGVDSLDDALLSLAAFAMSLGDISPTFYKIIASSSGEKGKIETFEAGSALSLYVEDKIQPIKITDSTTFGGLVIDILASKKKDENIKITLNARNNGTTQGTIEISKIQHI
jgi:hypothetical protein